MNPDNEDASYSFYKDKNVSRNSSMENLLLSETPPNPMENLIKRTRERWVEDSSTSECHKCHTTFRIYRRRHHCIKEGTEVTLSNGMSRKIEDIYKDQHVPSWNPDKNNMDLIEKRVDAVFDQGYENCFELTLQDGRTLAATSDHQILASTPRGLEYVKMSDLVPSDRLVCSTLHGVLDDTNNRNEIFSVRDNRLNFARMCGSRGIFDYFWNLTCSKSLQREFLASLLSKTAVLTENSLCLEFYSYGGVNLDQILRRFGIDTSIIVDSLILNVENLLKFSEKIGFRYNLEKQKKLTLITTYHKMKTKDTTYSDFLKEIEFSPENNYFTLGIVSKKEIGTFHVYDLSVPQNVSFVANGVVVHNCYNCGLVFCDACTSHREKIPKVVKKIPTRSGTEEPIDYNTPVRLCSNCFKHYDTIHKLEKLLMVFSLMDLNIFDFKNLSMVCKAWRPMALFYLSKFREIQYKLPNNPYNNWEKQALWSNRTILKSHSIWEIHVIKSVKNDPKRLEEAVRLYYGDTCSVNNSLNGSFNSSFTFGGCGSYDRNSEACWQRMCSRFCSHKLDVERALLLLEVLTPPSDLNRELNTKSFSKIAEQIVNAFDLCDDRILESYLPYILSFAGKNEIVTEWIFFRSSKSVRISNAVYWYLKNNCKTTFSTFCEMLPQNIYSKLIRVQCFVDQIDSVNTNPKERASKDFLNNIISPVAPELGDQKVNQKEIVIKKSATNPIFIPCNKSSILYKKDDIRKDYIIICIIRLMEKILQDSGLDIDLVTYNVQPTSDKDGFIQIVENCETLYGISEKLNTTIINYLMRHNPNESVGNLRKRFKNSCAAYSVIAFLLSISDRNTENLMLTQKGDLFHIDFGYCLDGNDPKIIKTSCIRITSQMLDALGGPESEEYGEFKELCGTIYDILRRHVNTFVCLLSLLPTYKSSSKTSPMVDEKAMMSEIIKRFCPGESYDEAIRNLKTKIDNSTDNSTLSKYHIIDFFHKHNKESTVSNFLGDTVYTAKNLISSVYSYLY